MPETMSRSELDDFLKTLPHTDNVHIEGNTHFFAPKYSQINGGNLYSIFCSTFEDACHGNGIYGFIATSAIYFRANAGICPINNIGIIRIDHNP